MQPSWCGMYRGAPSGLQWRTSGFSLSAISMHVNDSPAAAGTQTLFKALPQASCS